MNEEEEGFFKADAANEEDPERHRATQEEEELEEKVYSYSESSDTVKGPRARSKGARC